MKPTQAQSFVSYVERVATHFPTNKHSTENINHLKSLRDGCGLAIGDLLPDVYLHFWSIDREVESIEMCFKDGSSITFDEDGIKIFGARG